MPHLASLVSILSVLQKRYARWLDRWRAKSATNFKLRLAMLLSFGVFITFVGAALYRWSNPEEGWSSSLFTVYAILYNIPGSDITNHESLLATFVLNLIFIFGLLVFATILAMITDEINNVLLAARSGKAPVALSGHILLLNWNQQVPFILDQLEQIQLRGGTHPFANRPLVILADKDKEELDSLVLGLLKHGELEVHTRSGKPYKLEHLQRVAAADAFAVLLMHPEGGGGDDDGSSDAGGDGGGDEGGGGDDASVSVVGGVAGQDDSGGAAALKLQTIMALTSLQAGKKVAMVVQAPDDSNIGLQELDQVLLRAGHPANLMNLPVRKMVNSLAVQTTLQPWSASIYHSILQQGLQPSLTFTKVPDTLFLLKSDAVVGSLGSPTAAAARQPGNSSSNCSGFGGKPSSHKTSLLPSELLMRDCTVSFEDARVAVASDMLTIGYVCRGDGQLYLNPPESSRLSQGDVLVALTTQDKVANSGVKLPLSARIQAAALKAALVVNNHPATSKIMGSFSRQPAAATAAAGPDNGAGAAAGSSSGGVNGSSSSRSMGELEVIETAAGSTSRLDAIPEASPKGEASSAGTAAAAATAGSLEGVRQPQQQQPTKADTEISAAAAASPVATDSIAANKSTEVGGRAAAASELTAPKTPEPSARAASSGGTTAAPAAAAATAAGVGGTAAVAGTAAAAAAAASNGADAAAAADAAAPTAATPTASSARSVTSAPMKKRTKKKPSSSLFACCFAPSVDDEGDDDEGGVEVTSSSSKRPGLGAAPKSGSFKFGNMDIGKTVTGAVTSVGKGVTTVGKGVTSAVTTVADGAVGVTKTVVNKTVDTVADGAALVGKTVVSTATAMGDVVTSVADGAVGLSKTVATGAVAAAAGGAGLVTKTVAGAVKAPSNLLMRSESTAGAAGPAGGLLAAPTGWLFGGGKKQQQSDAKAAAFGRLANVDVAVARAPPAQPLKIVVAGFTADEAASELLPHFLDFAPANSTVTFVVKEASPPEGFEAQGTIEEEEEREGAEPLHHCVHYTFLPAGSPTSGAALSEAGLLQADAVLVAADEGLRSSPAEADAAVLSCLVSIQHLLSSKGPAVALSHSRSLAGKSSSSGSAAGGAGSGSASLLGAAGSSIFAGVATVGKGAMNVTKGAANLTFKAAASAVTVAKSLSMTPARDGSGLGVEGSSSSTSRAKPKVPHVVACVSTTSSKAVAAAFFGPPAASGKSSAGASGAAGGAGAAAGGGVGVEAGAGGVVGTRLFTYELLVPGEIEGSVLVQVANEPLYVKVVSEMLVSSEGCELYLLTPAAFGFAAGEELSFQEVQEMGRLLRRTAIGVVSNGRIELVPDNSWRWCVQENDRVAAIADSW